MTVGGLWVLALVAWGVLTVISWSSRVSMVIRTSSAVTPSSQFTVHTGTGDIELTTSIDDLVHVEAHVRYGLRRPSVTLRPTATGVEPSATCWWLDQACSVGYLVAVPRGLRTELETGSGDLTLHALTSDVRATTGSGDVRIRDSSGPLVLRTGSGDIAASGVVSGSVDARTGSGDVTLRFTAAPTTLRGQAGSGDIVVVVPAGQAYAVRTQAGSGDVSVRVPRDDASPHRVDLHTGSGDITVRTG